MSPSPPQRSGPERPAAPRRRVDLAGKPDFDRSMDRVYAWFEGEVVDRPPIRFYKHNVQFEVGERLDTSRWATLEDRWLDVEYQIDAFERSIEGKTFHAETFPVFWPNLGPSVYSAFYAGRLEFAEVTSWYEPVIDDLEDLSALDTDIFENRYFRKLEELTRAALKRCDGRYLVGYSDFHPSLDCVAAWRGVDRLCLDMVAAPGELSPLVELSVRDFHRIFNHFDAMLKTRGQPSITWMGIPSFGKLHIPSCDFASMISTKHFERFSLPQLRLELSGMDHAIYHVDGRGVAQHLDVILAQPEIQAIQWVQGLGRDQPMLQWVPLLRRILAAGKSVVVDVQVGELDEFIGAMPREGVFLCVGVEEGQEPDVIRRVEGW